jgi:N-acetyl-anhydromuramyl-L-alanine amidase AmpD
MSKRIEHCTPAEARDFFERLAVYSAEYVRVAIPQIRKDWPSKNHYGEWRDGAPIGNVLHYTAGTSFAGTVRYFTLERAASSHWVVGKALNREMDDLRKKLNLDRDLRAEVSQVVHPEHPAWHAGWVNRFLTGLECRNAGCLLPRLKGKAAHPGEPTRDDFFKYGDRDPEELDFYTWPAGWTTRFTGEVARVRVRGTTSFWESWSRGQVATVIVLLRYLNALYPGKLDPAWLVGHHQTCATKSDVVLPLDLHAIREAVLCSREHVDDLEWLAELDDVEDKFEDVDDPGLRRETAERQADRAEEDLDGFDPMEIQGALDTKEEVREALHRLGYYIGTPEAVRTSVRCYQRSRDLTVDGIAGPHTCARLERDLKAWHLR